MKYEYDFRHWIRLIEASEEPPPLLPADVVAAFEQLGSLQRGAPEMAMLRVQQTLGGGVMSGTAEHIGDIIHRMSHAVRYGSVLGREKIIKTLQWMTSPYGFEREMQENIMSNARYRHVPLDEFKRAATDALRAYAAAHAALPVYNEAQWLARQAAISLGLEEFDTVRNCLQQLVAMAPTEDEWTKHALQYTTDAHGKLLPYHHAAN